MIYKSRNYSFLLLPIFLLITGYFLLSSSAMAGPAVLDMSVDKVPDFNMVNAGEEIFYTIYVTNNGENNAANTVRVRDRIVQSGAGIILSASVYPSVNTPCTFGTFNIPNDQVICNFSSFPNGHTETIEIKVLVLPSYVASETDGTKIFLNRAEVQVTGGDVDPNSSNNEDNVNTTVEDWADLQVSKVCKPDGHVDAGQTATCYVNIANPGTSDSRTVILTDTLFLPAGTTIGVGKVLEWLTVDANKAGCQSAGQLNGGAGSNQLICNFTDPLPKGDAATVQYTFKVTQGIDVNNTATATCHSNVLQGTPDSDCSNNTAQSTINYDATADLRITKALNPDSSPYEPGDSIVYRLTVKNDGPSTAENVMVEDYLPSGVSFVSAVPSVGSCISGTPGDPSDPVVCSLGPIALDDTETIDITVVLLEGVVPPLINNARVSSVTFDPNLGNNLASLSLTVDDIVESADLSVEKDSLPPDIVHAGEELLYFITVTNHGPNTARRVELRDELPTGVTYLADTCECELSGNILTCDDDESLPAGDSFECVIKTLVPSDMVVLTDGIEVIENEARVRSLLTLDPDPRNNEAEKSNFVQDWTDLKITKICKPDEPLLAGTPGECKILVDNLGPSDARDVEVSDLIFSDGLFKITGITNLPMGATCTPNMFPTAPTSQTTVDCDLGDLSANNVDGMNRAEVLITFVADEDIDINDDANVDSLTHETNLINNQAEGSINVDGVADLRVSKSDSPDPVTAGEMLTYTIDVTNDGPSTAFNVVLKDIVPAGVTIDSVAGTGGAFCVTGVPGDPTQPTTCLFDTLANGAMRTMTIMVTVLPQTTGILHNDVCASSITFDDNNANDCDTENTDVDSEADLAITKVVVVPSSGDVSAGDPLGYLITIENLGPSTATGITLTDEIPDGTMFSSFQILTGTGNCELLPPPLFPPPDAIFQCSIGDLDPGEKAVISLILTVKPDVPDGTQICNTAEVASETTDPDLTNNSSEACINTATEADLWMEKQGNFPTGNPSGVIIFFCTVHNDTGCTTTPDDMTNSNICGIGGPSDAQNVRVRDIMPLPRKKLKIQFVSPGCTVSAFSSTTDQVTCGPADIQLGDKVTYEIQAQIQGSIKSDILNTCQILSTPTPDPDPTNNQHTVRIVVQGGTGTPGGPPPGRGGGPAR